VLALIAGLFVITTKNAIISVFNLIVLYILVAFYLIYIGIAYLGISYIVVYIGAIAILFLFVIMMIDIEIVEKKNNNYLLLLFSLLGAFIYTIKNILYNLGILKIKNFFYKESNKYYIDYENDILLNNMSDSNNNSVNLLTNPLFESESNKYLSETMITNYNNLISNINNNKIKDLNNIQN
jgi:NADH-ubiquinone oxidoreductase chain 6